MQDRSSGVISAKFDIPPLPLDYVSRSQLVERLERMARQRVTCIVAPMGYGKTCLLAEYAEYAHGRSRNVFWLSLDPLDEDPARLWRHMAALLKVDLGDKPPWASCAAAMRERAGSVSSGPISSSAANANDGALEADADVLLLIDRFELVCNSSSAEELLAFAESLPPRFHLVLATRCIPQRLSQRFADLGGFSLHYYDLAFTEEETTELVTRAVEVAGAGRSEGAEGDVLRITEGWPQGVAMASRTIIDHARGGADLRFGGSNIYVESYFGENVERRFDKDFMDFLVSLSAFERFGSGLISHALEIMETDAVMQRMLDSGILLVRCDTSGSWFRFNELFADWLRQRLASMPISEQCLMASVWLDERGRSAEAAKYMLMAVDYGYVENLVEAIYGLRRENHRTPFVLWLSRLSSAELENSPLVCALYAWAYNSAGYIEQTRKWGQRFEWLFDDGEPGASASSDLKFGSSIFLLKLDAMEGKCRAALQASEPILAVGEHSKPVVLSVVYQSRGEAHARMGLFGNASDEFIKACASAKAGGARHQEFFNLYSYADCCYRLANLDSAVASCDRLIAECPPEYSFVGASHALRARILMERGDFASARKDVDISLSITMPQRNLDLYMEALIAKAHYESNMGEVAAAYETAYSAVILGEQRSTPRDVLLRAYVTQALIAYELESAQEMEIIAMRISDCLVDDDEYGVLLCGYVNGLLLLKKGEALCALGELDRVYAETLRRGHKDLAIKVCVAKIAALDRMGGASQLVATARELVMLAMVPGYVASLLFLGEPIRRALRDVLASRDLNAKARGYVKRVLAAFEPYFERHYMQRALNVRGAEDLTARELEVLELLNRGMSRKEIAQTLCISVNTAKHHITHIYEKLGVSSKQGALDLVSR